MRTSCNSLARSALLVLAATLSVACSRGRVQDGDRATAATALSCDEAPGALDDVIAPGSLTILGEMHGTTEAPRFVSDVACQGAKLGRRVVVGLEISHKMQAKVDAFMASKGAPPEREALLVDEHWASPDGRGSAAMLHLLEQLRSFKQAGADVRVFFFDGKFDGMEARDRGMADEIMAQVEAESKSVILILCGNLHARTDNERWMGWHILQKHPRLRSFDFASAGGAHWGCTQEGCGPGPIRGTDRGGRPRIERFPTANEKGFSGYYYVGPATASPPARSVPDEVSGSAAGSTASPVAVGSPAARALADRAYEQKDYAGCAHLFRESAEQNRGMGAANDLYGAACCEALGGRAQEALVTLGVSIDRGFSNRSHLEADPDLVSLHALPGWAKLLARMGDVVETPPGGAQP